MEISFEICKGLKEKGFPQENIHDWNNYYDEAGEKVQIAGGVDVNPTYYTRIPTPEEMAEWVVKNS